MTKQERIDAVWAEYDKVTAAALAEYDKVTAPALVAAFRGMKETR